MKGTFLLDFQTEITQIEFIHEKDARFMAFKSLAGLGSFSISTVRGVNIFIVEGFNKEGSKRCDL